MSDKVVDIVKIYTVTISETEKYDIKKNRKVAEFKNQLLDHIRCPIVLVSTSGNVKLDRRQLDTNY